MSKIYNIYKNLKCNESSKNNLYLFKSGIFFIFIDEDARIASNLLGLKIGKLNDSIVKCGFPISSLEKYSKLLSNTTYSLKIVDTQSNSSSTSTNYLDNVEIKKVIDRILTTNIDDLSISNAFDFLYSIQNDFNEILNTPIKSKGDFLND